MITALTVFYLLAFQLCAIPSVARIVRRGSSQDLSIWREVLLICGASAQLGVMILTGADWRVVISPVATLCSVAMLLTVIWRYRAGAE